MIPQVVTEECKGSAKPILLISDLDDTIKITNTQSRIRMIYRSLFRDSAFTGMAQLYTEMIGLHPDSRFIVVSSSPPPIRKKILAFLKKNSFPEAKLVLRNWIKNPSIPRYKYKALRKIIRKSSAPVILVGDDTEFDAEIMCRVRDVSPERVLAVYIRRVKGKELPPTAIGFYTAFDIACNELASGRLSSQQVLQVGESVLRGTKLYRLIPKFSVLPPIHFSPFRGSPEKPILDLWEKIQKVLASIHKNR